VNFQIFTLGWIKIISFLSLDLNFLTKLVIAVKEDAHTGYVYYNIGALLFFSLND